MAALSEAWVWCLWLAGMEGSNPARGMDGCLSLVSAVCFQTEVSASGLSLVHGINNECGVSECDREA